ncbi:IclR family transcriptional regulator [Ahrensia sp. 13_GOM-1096m]|uniref:IclR family transcriptional regulator n=1 Tax=Ahrensia sp. 13_GOM-1096m TaxID=1380380 RepID=UPI0004791CBA|nr:IclR family transcriptional regulator C-terminal domain-containing protein [Ahrensia sp. 13_GOM-1096m]
MNSLDKMLAILNGFNEDNLTIDVNQAAELSGSSRPSAYRYIQAMTRSGLLTPASGGNYTIGSRVIELEMLKRENDPLLTAAGNLIRYHAEEMGINIMLCSYYGDKVLCADLAWTDHSIPQIYKAGRAMPIFKGAMAKVILAHLTKSQLKNIYSWSQDNIAENGLGSSLEEFTDNMKEIRKAGICITHAEIFDGLVGIAAPVCDNEGRVLGSVVFVLTGERTDKFSKDELAVEIRNIATDIEQGILRNKKFHDAGPVVAARPRRFKI